MNPTSRQGYQLSSPSPSSSIFNHPSSMHITNSSINGHRALMSAYGAICPIPSHEFYQNFYSSYAKSYKHDYYVTSIQASQRLEELYNLQNIISNDPSLKTGGNPPSQPTNTEKNPEADTKSPILYTNILTVLQEDDLVSAQKVMSTKLPGPEDLTNNPEDDIGAKMARLNKRNNLLIIRTQSSSSHSNRKKIRKNRDRRGGNNNSNNLNQGGGGGAGSGGGGNNPPNSNLGNKNRSRGFKKKRNSRGMPRRDEERKTNRQIDQISERVNFILESNTTITAAKTTAMPIENKPMNTPPNDKVIASAPPTNYNLNIPFDSTYRPGN